MTQTTSENRCLAREIPETELLNAILEEGNLTDARILGIEAQLLSDDSLDVGQMACLCLVLGRAGWNRSEGILRQMERRFLKKNHGVEAQAARLSIVLLASLPDARKLKRAEGGYLFHESGQPDLFVEDPLASHWHRQDRWGPPIRGNAPDQDLVSYDSSLGSKAVDAAMSGHWIQIEGQKGLWLVSRAGLRKSRNGAALIRWSRVRSIGEMGSNGGSRQLAVEVEGLPPQVITEDAEDSDGTAEFLIELYRRTR